VNPAIDWIDQARGLLDLLKQNVAAPATDADGHASDCRWCPLCQAAAVARGERPEVSAALADLLTATATALRSFSEEGRPPASDAPSPAADEPTAERPDDPPPVVQRIEIA
jgi:hypothetical protein